MFTLQNKNYLCIVGNHSEFSIITKTEDLAADSLLLACKIIFSEYGIPRKKYQMQVLNLFQKNSAES